MPTLSKLVLPPSYFLLLQVGCKALQWPKGGGPLWCHPLTATGGPLDVRCAAMTVPPLNE